MTPQRNECWSEKGAKGQGKESCVLCEETTTITAAVVENKHENLGEGGKKRGETPMFRELLQFPGYRYIGVALLVLGEASSKTGRRRRTSRS